MDQEPPGSFRNDMQAELLISIFMQSAVINAELNKHWAWIEYIEKYDRFRSVQPKDLIP